MNRFTISIFFALLALALVVPACQQEDDDEPMDLVPELLNCDLAGSNTLVAAGSSLTLEERREGVDYLIDCRIRVQGDLIVEPGVTIAFSSNAALEVRGSLSAIGTADEPIVFTGETEAPGGWGFIAFDSESVNNHLSHCVVKYAGGFRYSSNDDYGNVIVLSGARVKIDNTTLSDGAEYGIRLPSHESSLETFENNTITRCNVPAFLPTNQVGTISGGSFAGNNVDAIFVSTGGFGNSAILTENTTWEALDVPYRALKYIRVTSAALTLEPGTTVEFEAGTAIEVGDSDAAALVAVGTAEDPITFTGVTQVAGFWDGLIFHSTQSPLNEIGYATIEHGGSVSNEGAIYMFGAPILNVHDVDFRDIASCAIYAAPSTSSPNPNLTEMNNTTTNVAGGYLCGD